MAKKGNKMGGSHTTVIDAASKFVKLAAKIPGLKKYAPGYINTKAKAARSRMTIKIENGCVLTTVLGIRCSQEIRFYGETKYLEKQLQNAWDKSH